MNKRIIASILLIVMLFSSVISFADRLDMSGITNFDELIARMKTEQGDFKDKKDVERYWLGFLYSMFKEESDKGVELDTQGILGGGYWKYGTVDTVIARGEQAYDLAHNPQYIGYTAEGRLIPNIEVRETKLVKPQLVKISEFDDDPSKPYTGLAARPFKTKFTDPYEVGKMILDREAENKTRDEVTAYGKKVIRNWMYHTIARDTGWGRDGQSFTEITGVETVDKFIEHVAISIPPTSRTNGIAHVWFINNDPNIVGSSTRGHTRRTFVIGRTSVIDHRIDGELTWDEETMTINVPYRWGGMEPSYREMMFTVENDPAWGVLATPDDNFKRKDGKFHAQKGIIDLHSMPRGKDKYGFISTDTEKGNGWYRFRYVEAENTTSHEIENLDRKLAETDVREYKVSLKDILGEIRPEDTHLEVSVNTLLGHTEYGTKDNNFAKITIPATTALDFQLKAPEPEVTMTPGKTDIKVKATLKYLFQEDADEEIITDLVLHDKNGRELDRIKDIIFTKDTTEQDFKFEVDESVITEEETKLSVIINADYPLTKATPEEREKEDKLEDNKVEIIVKKPSADFSIQAETGSK